MFPVSSTNNSSAPNRRKKVKTAEEQQREDDLREAARERMVEHRKRLKVALDEKTSSRDIAAKEMEGDIQALCHSVNKNPAAFAHSSELGHVSELEGDVLQAVADKKIVYSEFDLTGHYHLHNIQHPYPIMGTQKKLEKERELILKAKYKVMNNKSIMNDKSSASSSPSSDSNNIKSTEKQKNQFYQKLAMNRLGFKFQNIENMLETYQTDVEEQLDFRKLRLKNNIQSDKNTIDLLDLFWKSLDENKFSKTKQLVIDGTVSTELLNTAVTRTKDGKIVTKIVSSDLGITPLMFACRYLNHELVSFLLLHGSDVRLSNANGNTACHWIFYDWPSRLSAKVPSRVFTKRMTISFDILKLLLQNVKTGAINVVNQQNYFGETLLHFCAKYGLESIATFLMDKYEANAFIKCERYGKTAAEVAKDSGFDNMHRMLLNFKNLKKAREDFNYQKNCKKLMTTRGALSMSNSKSSASFLLQLKNADRHVGNTGGRFLDREGNVLLAPIDKDLFLK